MKKIIYALIILLVVVSGLVFANREIKKETSKKSIPTTLSAAERQTEQTNVAEQAIKFKKEKVIRGITCPSCNGELDIKEGLRTFNCKYCGTLLTVKGESGTMKYFVPRKIKKEDAIAKTFGWLSSGFKKAKGLKEKAVISESFLVFIPYWRIRADNRRG